MRFTADEWMLMMIYSPGTRQGLIEALEQMQQDLSARDRNLRRWTNALLEKLRQISDDAFEALDLYPDLD